MFQFPGFASHELYIHSWMTPSGCPVTPGFPIRKSPDQSLFDNSPGHIAAYHVLHRLLTPRHPPCTLYSLTTIMRSCRSEFCVQVHFQRLRFLGFVSSALSQRSDSAEALSVEPVACISTIPWFAAFRTASAPKGVSTANHDEPASTSSIVKEPRRDPIRQYWPGWGRTAYHIRAPGGVKRLISRKKSTPRRQAGEIAVSDCQHEGYSLVEKTFRPTATPLGRPRVDRRGLGERGHPWDRPGVRLRSTVRQEPTPVAGLGTGRRTSATLSRRS